MNCRPQPYQGCALPLSYGGEKGEARLIANVGGCGKGKIGLIANERRGAVLAMSQTPPKPPQDKDDKAARLAAALRANLRRRKAPAKLTAASPTAKGAES